MKLEIKGLHVEVEGKEILKGVDLTINEGEFHVLMGPNGSGKSTLARAIMGHPKMKVTKGDILVNCKSIAKLSADKRAKLGIFLQFQSPVEVEGLGIISFLNSAKSSVSSVSSFKAFVEEIKSTAKNLGIKEDLAGRSLNYGFSGGEKKKLEITQMWLLRPKIAMLDEPDSGLDIDAVKTVATSISDFHENTKAGLLLITHGGRMLNYVKPKFVHVIMEGRIVKEGGPELIAEIEKKGYKLD